MQPCTSSRRSRATALAAACLAFALPCSAAVAEAASQRPAGAPAVACANHPERPGCPSVPVPLPVTEPAPPPQQPATAAADAPAAPPEQEPDATTSEPATTPQQQSDAIDDPPTIVVGTSEPPPADECRNLDGSQASVPEGMYIDAYGNCLEPANMTAGDGIDDGVEEGVRPVGTGAASGDVGAPPQAGSAGGASGGDASAQAGGGDVGGATAVAGAAAVPDAVSASVGADGALTASQLGRLPFTGRSIVVVLLPAIGLLLTGLCLAGMCRPRRTRTPGE